MIRKYEPWDIDSVMEIWLNANCSAHEFIDRGHFEDTYDEVKEMIPQLEGYVCDEEDEIKGFIGLENGYVKELFVKPSRQRNGVGKALLDHVKQDREVLMVNVYRKDEKAFYFCRREDFNVAEVAVEDSTGETEITMEWTRG